MSNPKARRRPESARGRRNRTRITPEQRANAARVWDRLLSLFKTQAALGARLGYRSGSATLVKFRRRWPAEVVLELEAACLAEIAATFKGPGAPFEVLAAIQLTRHHVRPDLYPRDGRYLPPLVVDDRPRVIPA